MAYTVTAKSTQLQQFEGQLTGSDPLRVNQHGGRLRVAAYSFTQSAELVVGDKVGLAIIPKGCVVVGIVSRFIKATNDSALTFGTYSVATGAVATGGVSSAEEHTGTVAAYSKYVFVVNPNVFTPTTEEAVVYAEILTANTGSNPGISGYILYVTD